MLNLICISQLINNQDTHIAELTDNKELTLDFNTVHENEIKYIDISEVDTKITVINTPEYISVSLIGQNINIFRSIITTHQSGFTIKPNFKTIIHINVTKSSKMTMYNKFASSLVYQTQIKLYFYDSTILRVAKSTWPQVFSNINIYQYNKIFFRLFSAIFPFYLYSNGEYSTYIYLFEKKVYFPNKFTTSSNVIIKTNYEKTSILFDNILSENNYTKFEAHDTDITIKNIDVYGILDFGNSKIKITSTQIYQFAQIICDSLTTEFFYIHLVQNNNYSIIANNIQIAKSRIYFEFLNISAIKIFKCNEYSIPESSEWEFIKKFKYSVQILENKEENEISLYVDYSKYYAYYEFTLTITEDKNKIDDQFHKYINRQNLNNIISYLPQRVLLLNIDIPHLYEEPIDLSCLTEVLTKISIIGPKGKYQKIYNLNINNRDINVNLAYLDLHNTSIICNMLRINSTILNEDFYSSSDFIATYLSPINYPKIHCNTSRISHITGDTRINDTVIVSQSIKISIENCKSIRFYCKNASIEHYLTNISKIQYFGNFFVNAHTYIDKFDHQYGNARFKLLEPMKDLTVRQNLTFFDGDNVFGPETSLKIFSNGIISSKNTQYYHIKNLVLINTSYDNYENIIFHPEILNVSTYSPRVFQGIHCNILSVAPKSLCMFDYIKDVQFIDIHYSVYECGYVYTDNFTMKYNENDGTYENLHIRLYNLEESNQIFYDDEWDGFKVDFLCAKEFHGNISSLSFEFISSHWFFNGTTRFFDIESSTENNQTCFSIVKRKQENSSSNSKKYWLFIVIGSISALFIIVVISVFLMIRHKKKVEINRFMSDTLLSGADVQII